MVGKPPIRMVIIIGLTVVCLSPAVARGRAKKQIQCHRADLIQFKAWAAIAHVMHVPFVQCRCWQALLSDWWFGTFLFFHILEIIIPID